MAKRVLLCLSHSIEEHDQLKLLTGLGYEVFSLGGYIWPSEPHDPKRPALPEAWHYPELKEAVDRQGVEDNIGSAQEHIPDEVLDWLGDDGVIVYHHYLSRLFNQWSHLKDFRRRGGRVVWRTVGQSTDANEKCASMYTGDGLEIVRYSPKERNIPGFAGEDALIRFYKDPAEWSGWNGQVPVVANVTQALLRRGAWTNAEWFAQVAGGLPMACAGPESELIPGGLGELPLEDMKQLLRDSRCYLYTGTQPASYTLGLLEALMTGVPVVSIGPGHMTMFPYGPDLFEGHELATWYSDKPELCRAMLCRMLEDGAVAADVSGEQRERAIAEFGVEKVGADWKAFLG